MSKFILDSEKCIACGLCVADCFPGYITMGENGPVYPGSCMMCGHCAAICPVNAITLPELDPATAMDYDEESFKVDPEKLLNSIRHRRSIRNYTGEKVSNEHLSLILEAGRCAPTASNTQKTRFIVVRGLSNKPTIINTNISMQEIADIYTPRVASRLMNYTTKKFVGNDIRQLKKIEKI